MSKRGVDTLGRCVIMPQASSTHTDQLSGRVWDGHMKHFPRVAISHEHLVVAGLGTVMWLEWTILEEVRVFKTSIDGESSTLFTKPGVFLKIKKKL